MNELLLPDILSRVLTRHVTISFHIQGVPDPLYGPWYHSWQPFDEDEATHGPITDRDRPPEMFIADVETRIQDLFNIQLRLRFSQFPDVCVQLQDHRSWKCSTCWFDRKLWSREPFLVDRSHAGSRRPQNHRAQSPPHCLCLIWSSIQSST